MYQQYNGKSTNAMACTSRTWCGRLAIMDNAPAELTISDARAHLADLVRRAHYRGEMTAITHRGRVNAGIVGSELIAAIKAAGGPDAALCILQDQAP
jgi:prevent-host-death family protein